MPSYPSRVWAAITSTSAWLSPNVDGSLDEGLLSGAETLLFGGLRSNVVPGSVIKPRALLTRWDTCLPSQSSNTTITQRKVHSQLFSLDTSVTSSRSTSENTRDWVPSRIYNPPTFVPTESMGNVGGLSMTRRHRSSRSGLSTVTHASDLISPSTPELVPSGSNTPDTSDTQHDLYTPNTGLTTPDVESIDLIHSHENETSKTKMEIGIDMVREVKVVGEDHVGSNGSNGSSGSVGSQTSECGWDEGKKVEKKGLRNWLGRKLRSASPRRWVI
ncbi:hypothetical protein TREMEDRAFT_57907 [Tremella mesenterica DSM 1558]|uniref:uncharacterized protein n=1 Tax=Tremella mesenterica (strain ATCC 24925 / CBS 8224 / DSM 1558 / NBRC 9311 / NRRL Y-6157 / RJB 2259-6 / UBC 559-6) TaxID=578456 RepID=UPI00032D0BE1|nr:uncharacterized protein TREMEDRAFT_57907 [Tremella mesenterica DSM 1558]EIW65749.1 hypothetical protein TREMEDRAFT_57907 [Tremella mesenterica DSM 1558]